MTTQSGITVESPGKPWTIVSSIPRPSPGKKQALVRSVVVGLNPVDPMQQQYGILVDEWPAVLGSDFAGLVLEVGEGCTKLKTGDYVFSCAFIGQNRYTPLQENFLVDEDLVFKKDEGTSLQGGSTFGAGLLTASLGLLAGTGITLPAPGTTPPKKEDWIIILGGSGTVGQFAVQLAKLCGYNVLASSSPSKASIPIRQGATTTFDSRAALEQQIAEIKKVTGGAFARVFDASAAGYDLAINALESASEAPVKYFSSVDDWSPFNTPSTIKEYRAELGHLGRYDEDLGATVSKQIAEWIPNLEEHIKHGSIKAIDYELVEGLGWEKAIEGLEKLTDGKATRKLAVVVGTEAVQS
ncbi:related to oxidoreductase [Cephalotrichum gorgonifer]|uniref:Related to oxidoreductase n=1 Tax=Cephalotrichum gorgonifer TaxID=2041049 RepID=A0AAE8MX95_9PEZI|nr:related to oxidoreductase [Cephalotrichum gorgonifer]